MILGIDTTAPLVSVALGRGSTIVECEVLPQRTASEALLGSIRACLARADMGLKQLDGIVCLAGPGSFTGIRIGMATVLALHEATGLPCTAVPTLSALAMLARTPGLESSKSMVSVVDALRGQFFVQAFTRPRSTALPDQQLPVATGEALRMPGQELLSRLALETIDCLALAASRECRQQLAEQLEAAGMDVRVKAAGFEMPTLAELAIQMAESDDFSWQPKTLSHPLYLQSPAVTRPSKASRSKGSPRA